MEGNGFRTWRKVLLKQKKTRSLPEFYLELKNEGKINPKDYADEHDLSPSTAAKYGQRLLEIGLVERKKRGHRVVYIVSDFGERIPAEDFENVVRLTSIWFDILCHLAAKETEDPDQCRNPNSVPQSTGRDATTVRKYFKRLEEMDYLVSYLGSNEDSPPTYKLTGEGKRALKRHCQIPITSREKEYLEILNKGEITLTDLKERLNLSRAATREMLNRLAEMGETGLVEMKKGRSSLICQITPEGERALEIPGLTRHERRDMKLLEEQGELAVSELKDSLGFKTKSKIKARLNRLAEKGEPGLVGEGKRKKKDVRCYRLTSKGERTVEFWSRSLLSPKLTEIIRVGKDHDQAELSYPFRLGWVRNWDLSKEEISEFIEDKKLIEEFEECKPFERRARTGELAALIDYGVPDVDLAFQIGRAIQEHLPWELEEIEEKLLE